MAVNDNPLGRRLENRVVACLLCGDTLGIYQEGERPPAWDHACEP
jgi:hypothetical protein